MPVPAAVALAPAALSLVSNVAGFFGANSQQKKDKEELANLATPFYKIQDEFYGNRNSALQSAQGGLTQDSKDFYTDQVSRGLGTGISAILEGKGNPNDIARLMDSYSSGIKSVAAEDATRQIDNIRYFHRMNTELAGEKIKQWTINEYQPYQNKLKELTERIAADKQNKFNAIQGAIGSVQAGATSLQNNDLMKNLFKDGTGAGLGTTAADTSGGLSDPFRSNEGVPTSWNKNAQPSDTNYSNVAEQAINDPNLMLSDEQKAGLYKYFNGGQ